MSDRVTGVCKWFNNEESYGFIEEPNTEEDIFVHFSEIMMDGFKKLDEGDRVEFEPVETDDGIQAQEVIKIS